MMNFRNQQTNKQNWMGMILGLGKSLALVPRGQSWGTRQSSSAIWCFNYIVTLDGYRLLPLSFSTAHPNTSLISRSSFEKGKK